MVCGAGNIFYNVQSYKYNSKKQADDSIYVKKEVVKYWQSTTN